MDCKGVRKIKANMLCQRLLAERLYAEVGWGISEKRKRFYLDSFRENDMAFAVLVELEEHLKEMVEIYQMTGLLEPRKLVKLLDAIPQDKVELRALLMRKQAGSFWGGDKGNLNRKI